MLSILFLGIFSIIVAFYLRVKPRLSQENFGIDSWYYLIYADEFRKTKKLPVKLPYFLLDVDEQWYPPALVMLLSLFSQRFLEKTHWIISPLIDILQMSILYLVACFLTGNIWLAFTAALLYGTSPILVTQNSNLNSRALGALVFIFLMLSLYRFVSFAQYPNFIAMVLLGVVLLHTHKLASQQMFFLFIGLSLWYLNPVFIFILAAVYFFACIFSFGFYFKILKGHIAILKFWKKNLPFLFAHQIYKSPIYANPKKAAIKRGCGGIASNRLWFIFAKAQYILLFIAIAGYVFLNKQKLTTYDNFFWAWFLINFICVVMITYAKPIKFLGEGQRYFMYGVFPASILVSRFIFSASLDIHIGILILGGLLILNLLLINKVHSEQNKNILGAIDSDLRAILEYIRTLPKNNIMCFPVSYCEAVAYFCRKKVLWGAHSSGYDKLESFFPVLLRPVDDFIKQYSISYCLINKNYVDLEDLCLSSKYKILIEKTNYYLLEVIG